MEAVVEVALPVATDAAKLMGSSDGSGAGRDDSYDDNNIVSTSWPKILDPKLYVEGGPPSRIVSDAVLNDLGSSKANSSSCKDLDSNFLLERSCKKLRNSGGVTKKPRVVQEAISKCKAESGNANGSSADVFLNPTSLSLSGKTQSFKQKYNVTCGRGYKRSKDKCKNRSETSFFKNGLVDYCSGLGVNDLSGIYGQAHDALDISKYAGEISLDELRKGVCSYPSVAVKKWKGSADSNAIFLQSVQKACSLFQHQKVVHLETEPEGSSVQDVSTAFPPDASEVDQTAEAIEYKQHMDRLSCIKDQDSVSTIKLSSGANPPHHHPKDVLDRLLLPQPTVSDLLSSERIKGTSSRNISDPRSAKMASHQHGLPPFPWSHSFSGHNKSGFDAFKLSACRAVCQGKWIKAKNSIVSLSGSADLQVDIDSLKFNQSLVPPIRSLPDQPKDRICASRSCSSLPVADSIESHGDESSPAFAAAHTLLHIAARKPPKVAMKASKLNAAHRTSKVSDDSKAKARRLHPFKIGGDGFPLKKRRLSTDRQLHDDGLRKAPPHRSAPALIKSRNTKLLSSGRFVSDSNHVHKSFMKPRQVTDWPNSSRQKLWKSAA